LHWTAKAVQCFLKKGIFMVKPDFQKIKDVLKKYMWVILSCILFLLIISNVVLFCSVRALKNTKTETAAPIQYVYNAEQLIRNFSALTEVKQVFEKQISVLNTKVNEAREKLDGMKDKKAKEEYATVYLSSLTLQRDQLVEQYQKDLNVLSQKIDQALVDVANENGLPYVFDAKAIVVTTPHVVDVTGAVLKKLQ